MDRLILGVALLALAGSHVAQTLRASQASSAESKNAAAIEFVRIQPGEFMMGCSAGDTDCKTDEQPAHLVKITKAFDIGKYEVTQAQWTSVMGSNPSTMKDDHRPVETVTKPEVERFLALLNERHDGYRYRLPTEAEWEYAARAGSQSAYGGPLDEVAWYSANSDDESHAVGGKKPNAWGLYDMQGNVREWVADLYSANYYRNSPVDDPTGPAANQGGGPDGGRPRGNGQRGGGPRGGPGRGGPRQLPVMRGGAWDNPAAFLRVSARYNYYGPTLRVSDLGFRAARDRIE
jgi:formylglycine-generating enzyme required for sulfatase activity